LKKIHENSRRQFVLKIAKKFQKLKKKVFLKFIAKVTKSLFSEIIPKIMRKKSRKSTQNFEKNS